MIICNKPVALAVMVVALSCGPLRAQANGSLRGIAVTPDGKPIAGLTISANVLVGAEAKLHAPWFGVIAVKGAPAGTAATAKDGSFTIANLPPAAYVLCAKAMPGYLDPCEWGPQSIASDVVAGQNEAILKMTVRPSSTLTIRLNDAAGLLSQPAHAGHIMVGVTAPRGGFHPSAQTAKDAAGFLYQVDVPLDVAVGVRVQSSHVTLADATGARVSEADPDKPVQLLSGADNSKPVVFTVTGVKP